jgi:hypothetical protein
MAVSPEGIAWVIALLIVFPLVWLVGMIRLRSGRLLWTAAFASIYVGVALLPTVASHSGSYTLRVQILDPQHRPLPGVTVSYHTNPASDRFGRFSPSLEGEATTDALGEIVLHPNHAHGVSIAIRHADPSQIGFRASFRIEAAGKRYGHQILPTERLTFIEPPEPPPSTGEFHGSWVFPPLPEHRIIVALNPK